MVGAVEMDDIILIPHLFILNSAVILIVGILIIILVLVKVWTAVRAFPTDAELAVCRNGDMC